MIPPALREAVTDPAIRGAPFAVYVYLVVEDMLAVHEYRPLKAASVANALHLKDVTAARALRRLTERHYLLRRGTDRARKYRLVWSRKPDKGKH